MCTYSMVMDWGMEKLSPYKIEPYTPTIIPNGPLVPNTDSTKIEYVPSEAWRKQFLKDLVDLLTKAKEYDEANGEPDCELDSKKEKLKAVADELGVEISFP